MPQASTPGPSQEAVVPDSCQQVHSRSHGMFSTPRRLALLPRPLRPRAARTDRHACPEKDQDASQSCINGGSHAYQEEEENSVSCSVAYCSILFVTEMPVLIWS